MSEGAIDLSQGEADPLKGPTDVGTGRETDTDVALSTLVDKLNERFGTDFTEADQLFFDQVRATAERDEKIVEAAKANSLANFSAFFGRVLEDLVHPAHGGQRRNLLPRDGRQGFSAGRARAHRERSLRQNQRMARNHRIECEQRSQVIAGLSRAS